jgi:hypothetical protein
VTDGIAMKERVEFFDGPFAIEISKTQKGFMDLNFLYNEKSDYCTTVEVDHLRHNSVSVASFRFRTNARTRRGRSETPRSSSDFLPGILVTVLQFRVA